MNCGTTFVLKASLGKQSNQHAWEENGMEFTIGELKVPSFYFLDEKKFRRQLTKILKLRIHNDFWIKGVIQHTFLHDWCMEPFTPWCAKKRFYSLKEKVKETTDYERRLNFNIRMNLENLYLYLE